MELHNYEKIASLISLKSLLLVVAPRSVDGESATDCIVHILYIEKLTHTKILKLML